MLTLGFNDGIFSCDVMAMFLFSRMMLYRLFLVISYHHHWCDYFPKPSDPIIIWCFFLILRLLGFFEGLGGFQAYIQKASDVAVMAFLAKKNGGKLGLTMA